MAEEGCKVTEAALGGATWSSHRARVAYFYIFEFTENQQRLLQFYSGHHGNPPHWQVTDANLPQIPGKDGTGVPRP